MMRFSLDQLATFAAAARERSFSATARRLGKAQSAISMAISDLEVDLGISLFDRSSRYPVLTSAGETLLAEVEAVLSHCESLHERANALTNGVEAKVVLAVEDAMPCLAIAPILSEFHKKFPIVQLDVLQPSAQDLSTLVSSQAAVIGLGCARPHYPAGINFTRLGEVTLINVVQREHPLANAEGIGFAQLADHLQLLIPSQIHHLSTSGYLKSPKRWYLQSEVALLDMLRGGLGWSTVPRRLITDELASGDLVELKLKAYPFTDYTVGLDAIWLSDSRLGAAATWLLARISKTQIFC